jgi:hypothetical protein
MFKNHKTVKSVRKTKVQKTNFKRQLNGKAIKLKTLTFSTVPRSSTSTVPPPFSSSTVQPLLFFFHLIIKSSIQAVQPLSDSLQDSNRFPSPNKLSNVSLHRPTKSITVRVQNLFKFQTIFRFSSNLSSASLR